MQNLEELQTWLSRQNNIPKKRYRVNTLMDIVGVTHLENNWSDVYAYFFKQHESHGLGRLFIDTLKDLVAQATGKPTLEMSDYNVVREEGVLDEKGNNKRIDLLIQNEEEAFIIENKVYAKLYNRLDLYWKKPSVPDENKRGVVLSLWPTKPTHGEFINITHESFAKAIEQALPKYFVGAQPKALMLLQDFILNIYNVTHSMNEEELKFYFANGNREKINRLAEIRKNVVTYIWQTIEDGNHLKSLFHNNGWKLSVKTKNNVNFVYYTFDAMPNNVMLTLVYDTLWNYDHNGCRIRMFLEIKSKEMIQFVENHAAELKEMGVEPDGHKKETSWWHYRGYEIPFSVEDFANKDAIASKIIEGIKASGFFEYGLKIIELCKNNK